MGNGFGTQEHVPWCGPRAAAVQCASAQQHWKLFEVCSSSSSKGVPSCVWLSQVGVHTQQLRLCLCCTWHASSGPQSPSGSGGLRIGIDFFAVHIRAAANGLCCSATVRGVLLGPWLCTDMNVATDVCIVSLVRVLSWRDFLMSTCCCQAADTASMACAMFSWVWSST